MSAVIVLLTSAHGFSCLCYGASHVGGMTNLQITFAYLGMLLPSRLLNEYS